MMSGSRPTWLGRWLTDSAKQQMRLRHMVRNSGEYIVNAAAQAFTEDVVRELRAKLMEVAQAEIEHTIHEVVRKLNTRTTAREDHFRMEYPITFYCEIKR
ncbi:hypothetical protein B5P22_24520 [Pseudomonas tolaasii]|nr:hypothetical protein B5P22_24520 [Pseudomonas tolaasii]